MHMTAKLLSVARSAGSMTPALKRVIIEGSRAILRAIRTWRHFAFETVLFTGQNLTWNRHNEPALLFRPLEYYEPWGVGSVADGGPRRGEHARGTISSQNSHLQNMWEQMACQEPPQRPFKITSLLWKFIWFELQNLSPLSRWYKHSQPLCFKLIQCRSHKCLTGRSLDWTYSILYHKTSSIGLFDI